ncbi:hypothetical protein PGT21_008313 [Puccinia graminis f. sp. tritici]|uniref:Uncharacterized protein n=1 Tax=Puccinia graminis f. sp. tritici TaxID=56615 RepID=A0A5B0P8C7_PUCGR|nr:hypothetical protein PGT21_008313 [Puccinia graminis f. sp. tritici]
MVAPHTPPVTSPLAHPGQRPAKPVRFGSRNCRPKCCLLVRVRTAHQMPMVTSSATHSYRFTDDGGMELFSEEGKLDVLQRRPGRLFLLGSSITSQKNSSIARDSSIFELPYLNIFQPYHGFQESFKFFDKTRNLLEEDLPGRNPARRKGENSIRHLHSTCYLF